MPRFTPNPTAVDAGIPILPKDEYELMLGEPKSFFGNGKDGKEDNHGVNFPLIVMEGEKKGKRIFKRCFMHTEPAQGFSKQFQMAALGYNPKDQDDEARFNTEHGNDDWSYDSDNGSCGEAWHAMKGQRIIASLDVGVNKTTNDPQQLEKGYRPFGK